MWLALHRLMFPSWSCLRTALSFFSTTSYGTGSKLGDSLLSQLLLSRMWSPSPISLYCADCLPSVYSVEVSPSHLFCEEAANGPRWFFWPLLLGMVTLGSFSEASTHQGLGWWQSTAEVWFGTGREYFVKPFSSLFLPFKVANQRNMQYSRSARFHYHSVVSRGIFWGELFQGNLESLQTPRRRVAGHCHWEHFQVSHVFKKYPHSSCDVRYIRIGLFQQKIALGNLTLRAALLSRGCA